MKIEIESETLRGIKTSKIILDITLKMAEKDRSYHINTAFYTAPALFTPHH